MGDFMQDYPSKLADHLAGTALQININTAAGRIRKGVFKKNKTRFSSQGRILNLSNGNIPSRYNLPAL
jgi:hypothetical protein